ncbi:MAG TPA: acetylxylan esterase [Blastocatellia bacterium]|jgi:dienelactone hydrolase|nr:acetylxylan esterase [Blastocatellia bacterium]
MKKLPRLPPRALALLLALVAPASLAQEIPKNDIRLTEIRHLDLTYDFAGYRSKEEWLDRAARLKKQILVSAGLWPAPAKTPIKATIFGKVDRGDHTIEKVYFESYPGFYVTGNLYRPKNVSGKIPAVLCTHGHWTYGRLENQQLNSVPARAVSFARQGYVAFSYDMVGYNDSAAISHRFAAGHRENIVDRESLWSVNLLGLQLWDSIRSIDFLLTLPEVDPERIACTGESGGGTQTFLLTAVDDRVKLSAPVNMVSFLMQGGSLCENAPNLRIDTNNVEIASLMAPRPMMLVSATGDWTKNMMTSEYPAVRGVYKLFDAEDKLTAVQMDAPHNYNQPSREAVYGWFAHWFLGKAETTPIKERGVSVPSINDLLVFVGRPRPENELNESQLTESLIEARKRQLDEGRPHDAAGLERFRERFGEAFRYSLMDEFPASKDIIAGEAQTTKLDRATKEDLVISRRGKSDRVSVTLYSPLAEQSANSTVLLVASDGAATNDLIEALNKAGHDVAVVRCFPGGRQIPEKIKFFSTYNRTDAANRAQDILTAISYLKGRNPNAGLNVIGVGEAGLWALLARGIAPAIDRMVIDAAHFDSSSDEAFIKSVAIPGIRRAGDFTTAATIAPLTRLLIHNTGYKFNAGKIKAVYKAFGKGRDFKSQSAKLSDAKIIAWLSSK